ncbi:MAG TPA: alanine--tRNA ligase [Chthoniobacterales bacterium]
MTANEIRQSFLDFFREKRHAIVPSSTLLPSSPNLLFTNAGMNQFVPFFLGQKKAPYDPPRAADTQKCIRAGGKHNDLDDVGFDTYHHTFFEMLGNWSFGDYFKREAIAWAWELLVGRWQFPPERLYASVYQPGPGDPASFDQEAHDCWAEHFRTAGLDPEVHVVSGNRKDNFWMMGDTGPCGPCSEVHMNLTPEGNTAGALVNAGDPRCIEIWNLVFIQFNANPDGSFSALPARHVDTGMGFERVAGIMAGTRGFQDFSKPTSNYDSGVFRPLFDAIARLSGKAYQGTLPGSRANLSGLEKSDVAFRVVADHVRTLSFAIADGIIPGNTDRNYVLRRILRRAVLFGRYLSSEGFLAQLVPTVVQEFSGVFPELGKSAARIAEVVHGEESLFNRTLDRGLRIFEEAAAAQPGTAFPAEVAFKLSDTYGFPVDLTEVLTRERGLTLDLAAVEVLLDHQRERSRGAQQKEVITLNAAGEVGVTERPGGLETEFVGFDHDETRGVVLDVIRNNGAVLAAVDRSPFYAEMGGQVSDTGEVLLDAGTSLPVEKAIRQGRTFYLQLAETVELRKNANVRLLVDRDRRRQIEANHTGTHLLHWALHEVVGPEVSQKGSYVGPDRLRFDFNSQPLTPVQITELERLINAQVIADEPVAWIEVPYPEVKSRPNIMQFFGEKYGDTVRVVQIGGHAGRLDGYSMELCGGTHVRRTGQLGFFKIVSEGAIQSGVRRVEAVTRLAAYEHVQHLLADRDARVQALQQEALEAKKQLEKERAQALQREANRWLAALDVAQPFFIESLPDASPDYLQTLAQGLKGRQYSGVAVFFSAAAQGIAVQVYVGSQASARYHAGKLVQEICGWLDGKGGGRPDLARGAGKDPGRLQEVMARLRERFASA